ncbi:MAG: hypothetical protein JWN70_5346 [Planctomycetaceae bacterium]|nr:hypothetical protein [Planctomycetaceae bacterium]
MSKTSKNGREFAGWHIRFSNLCERSELEAQFVSGSAQQWKEERGKVTCSPQELAKKFVWKNFPEKVTLLKLVECQLYESVFPELQYGQCGSIRTDSGG